MDGFELREEIEHGNRRYFLQTSYIPNKKQIQSSFFKNGVVFDTVMKKVEEKAKPERLKAIAREIHGDNKKKFLFILNVRDKIKSYNDPKPHLKLAQVLFRRNLYEEAIQEAQLAIDKGDQDSVPYIVIGESYFKMGAYDKANDAVSKGISFNPEYPDLHNLMGQIYLAQKNCKPAIDSFKRAIGQNLYYSEPYLNLAKAYLLNTIVKEDYELSKELETKFYGNLDRASQLYPSIQGDLLERAKRLFKEKRYKETLEALDEIEEKSRGEAIEDIFLELYLAVLYNSKSLTESDIQGYLDRVEAIIDQNPTYADGYNSLGILYTAKCKIFMDSAVEAFTRALEINSKYQNAQKNLRLAENDRQGIFILLKALLD